MRCMRCGAELRPDAKFCGVCGQVMGGQPTGAQPMMGGQPMGGQPSGRQPRMGNQHTGAQPMTGGQPMMGGQSMGGRPTMAGYPPQQDSTVSILANAIKTAGRNAYERAREANRIQGGVTFGVDEQVVRHYQIGRYTLRKGAIEMIVTNKRVIRFEESSLFGMRNTIIDEIDIQNISGVGASMRRSASILGLSIGIPLLIAGIVGLFQTREISPLISIGATLVAVIILFLSLKPSLNFYVYGGGGKSLETVVNNRGRIFGRHNIGVFFQFKPTPEVAPMVKEIGALIYDLRTLGDKAIERWS